MLEIGAHVEGETVKGDVAFHSNPDSGYLYVTDPHTGIARASDAGDSIARKDVDDNAFEPPQVLTDKSSYRKDRIADQLPWTVVGDVSAAFDVVKRKPLRAQVVFTYKKMLVAAFFAESDDGRMFDKKQGGWSLSSYDSCMGLELHRMGFSVVEIAEIAHHESVFHTLIITEPRSLPCSTPFNLPPQVLA
jgi:hypothetical protein